MKNKKIIAVVMSLVITAGSISFPALCSAAEEEITYTIENDLDDSGEWKYRELVPDLECETLDNFTSKGSNTSGSDTQEDTKLNEDAYRGNYSLSRKTRASAGIGFRIPCMQSGGTYVFSAWMKGECNGADLVKASPARNYTKTAGGATEAPFEKASGTGNTQFHLTDSWEYYSADIKAPSDISPTNSVHIYLASMMDSGYKDNTGKYVQKIFIDDWSLRLMVPDDFIETKMLSSQYDSESATITYKFNLDIDPRTVTAERICVNSETNSEFIESATLETTNENTREHTLSVTLKNMQQGTTYAVTLPEMRDAWGRIVSENNAVIIGNYPEGQYTVFDDLDDSGKWKYRELIPDVGCETITGFWDKSATPTPPDTKVALSTDAYRGRYSVSRTMSGYAGLGAKVENLDIYTEENPAEYLLTMYAKADLAEGLTSINLTPCYSLNPLNAGKTETAFRYPNTDMQIAINDEWRRYTKSLRILDVTSIDKSKDMYMYFYAFATGRPSNTIYLDEFSLRRNLPKDFFAAEITDASYSDNTAVFTFNLDIDPRTVREEDILINGAPQESVIEDITITTDEYTRITTMEIELSNLKSEMDYTIDISGVKDAWGRDITGQKTVEFSTLPAVSMSASFEMENEDVTSLSAGELDIDLVLTSNIGNADVTIVAATCKNGVFTSVTPVEETLAAGSNTIDTITVTVGADDDAVRIFVWSDAGVVMTPLAKFGELTASGFKGEGY